MLDVAKDIAYLAQAYHKAGYTTFTCKVDYPEGKKSISDLPPRWNHILHSEWEVSECVSPSHNALAMRTDDLVVLDVDDPGEFKRWVYAAGLQGKLSATCMQQTPRGIHIFYKVPPRTVMPSVSNAVRLCGLPIDIRSRNGFVLVHPTPGYSWMSSILVQRVPPCPTFLWTLIQAHSTASNSSPPRTLPSLTTLAAKVAGMTLNDDSEECPAVLADSGWVPSNSGTFPATVLRHPDRERDPRYLVTVAEVKSYYSTFEPAFGGITESHDGMYAKGSLISRREPSRLLKKPRVGSLDTWTNGLFWGINWDNLLLAGGSTLGWICPWKSGNGGASGNSDHDLFIYGLDGAEFAAKVREVCERVCSNAKGARVVYVRSRWAITMYFEPKSGYCALPPVQIILRAHDTVANVLSNFDIDCCCFGYDGQRVVALPRGVIAVATKTNIADGAKSSVSYEHRLAKYVSRGFGVFVPGLETPRKTDLLLSVPRHGPRKLQALVRFGSRNPQMEVSYAPVFPVNASLEKIRLGVKTYNARARKFMEDLGMEFLANPFKVYADVVELYHDLSATSAFNTPGPTLRATHEEWLAWK